MNLRIVQEVYSKQDCPSEDNMRSVFSATTKQGSEIHVVQIPHLVTLPPPCTVHYWT